MSKIYLFVETNIVLFSSPGRHKKYEFSQKSDKSHPCNFYVKVVGSTPLRYWFHMNSFRISTWMYVFFNKNYYVKFAQRIKNIRFGFENRLQNLLLNHRFELPLANGQSWFWHCAIIAKVVGSHPVRGMTVIFFHRNRESAEYTVLTHIGVFG